MSITLTKKEHNTLLEKSKRGWRFYFALRANCWQQDASVIEDLEDIIKMLYDESDIVKDNIQQLLDGHKLRVRCCICLEDDLDKDNSSMLLCLHRFHEDCLQEYRESSMDYKCPICRK